MYVILFVISAIPMQLQIIIVNKLFASDKNQTTHFNKQHTHRFISQINL